MCGNTDVGSVQLWNVHLQALFCSHSQYLTIICNVTIVSWQFSRLPSSFLCHSGFDVLGLSTHLFYLLIFFFFFSCTYLVAFLALCFLVLIPLHCLLQFILNQKKRETKKIHLLFYNNLVSSGGKKKKRYKRYIFQTPNT